MVVEKITASKISLDSILNPLHNKDMRITNECHSDDLKSESYMSIVTMSCVLDQTDQMSDGEQSSTCSQMLDGMTTQPQSTPALDMTTTSKHTCIEIDLPLNVSASYRNDFVTAPVYFEFPQCKK